MPNGNNQVLSTKNAEYPMCRTEIKTFTIPRGDMLVAKENIITGQMPGRIVIGILESDAYHRNWKNVRSSLKVSIWIIMSPLVMVSDFRAAYHWYRSCRILKRLQCNHYPVLSIWAGQCRIRSHKQRHSSTRDEIHRSFTIFCYGICLRRIRLSARD